MTVKGLYEAMLIELNKIEAPSLLLEDFNYLINKAIYQYTNKWYNQYDVNQQTTDSLRVLKSTAVLDPTENSTITSDMSLYSNVEEFELPKDYFHILNCICEFDVKKDHKCYSKDDKVFFKASRLTSDMWGSIINNFYMRPSYKKPYFYIHNINTAAEGSHPTNPVGTNNHFGTDLSGDGLPNDTKSTNNYDQVITIGGGKSVSTIDSERTSGIRYGNPAPIRMEIRYGKDNKVFSLSKVYIDYLKVPQTVILTQEQLDSVEDMTQILEFPDYICYEIVNELVKLVMENSSDPRLQTHIPVNQTIAPPAGSSQQK